VHFSRSYTKLEGERGDSSTETRCGLDMDGFLPLKGVVKDPSERGPS
jgi:hypothetical protein